MNKADKTSMAEDSSSSQSDVDAKPPLGLSGRLLKYRFGITLSLLVLAFILVVMWRDILVPKYPGEQGIYWSRFFGGTSDMLLGEGTHLKFPWDEIYIYSTRVMKVSDKTVLLTKEGMEIVVDWAARYRIDPAHLPELHRNLGPDYANKVVVPEVISSLRQVFGKYSAEEIYAKSEEDLLEEIDDRARTRMEMFHPIIFETMLLLSLSLPREMQQGIVDKLLYEQRLLSYHYRLRAEEEEKKRKVIEAQGIKAFEETSKVSMLKWRGIDATLELARSPNTKIVVMGTGQNNMPLLLNADGPTTEGQAGKPAASAGSARQDKTAKQP
ncbi:MAG: prohibitin family protein [Sterolibacteriaceae bacterium MAG5]|nr:prohibitin family protein [Candidatus Nitricoxidireducens bremensis]